MCVIILSGVVGGRSMCVIIPSGIVGEGRRGGGVPFYRVLVDDNIIEELAFSIIRCSTAVIYMHTIQCTLYIHMWLCGLCSHFIVNCRLQY